MSFVGHNILCYDIKSRSTVTRTIQARLHQSANSIATMCCRLTSGVADLSACHAVCARNVWFRLLLNYIDNRRCLFDRLCQMWLTTMNTKWYKKSSEWLLTSGLVFLSISHVVWDGQQMCVHVFGKWQYEANKMTPTYIYHMNQHVIATINYQNMFIWCKVTRKTS